LRTTRFRISKGRMRSSCNLESQFRDRLKEPIGQRFLGARLSGQAIRRSSPTGLVSRRMIHLHHADDFSI
jgi:hypothetical protein